MTPRKLSSGQWNIRVTANGITQSITGSKAYCEAEYRRIKAEVSSDIKIMASPTLGDAIDKYIADRRNVLSPTTVKGYEAIRRTHLQEYMDVEVDRINWQKVINEESKRYSPKSIKNLYGLLRSACAVPKLTIPQQKKPETEWLRPEQIPVFMEAVKDKPYEIACLLGLHGLRRSEIFGLDWKDVTPKQIIVKNALVIGDDGKVEKTTKTYSSTRVVPVFIPRLSDLIKEYKGTGKVCTSHPNSLYKSINRECQKAALPLIGVHGLRRSFCSLCYGRVSELVCMKLGGWENLDTVHRHYLKLSERDEIEGINELKSFYKNC